jgi:hypothetical protein
MNEKTKAQKVENIVGMKISDFGEYSDGFSFTVPTEAEAYKAAYALREYGWTSVRALASGNGWYVQLITK